MIFQTVFDSQSPNYCLKADLLCGNGFLEFDFIQKNSNNFTAESKAIARDGQMKEGGANCAANVIYCIEAEDGKIWYADEFRGIRYTDGIDFGCNVLAFSGYMLLIAIVLAAATFFNLRRLPQK